jgi:hypothetical protein
MLIEKESRSCYMRISNPPVASSLMATARSFGNYDLASALADLIDNSIKAKASSISINFQPEENGVVVRIRDNGCGMSKEELIAAMRPASSNPEDSRDLSDLGRFGWGMKSASLSQARILTVISWTANGYAAAIWNIDDIDDWSMELVTGLKAQKFLNSPPASKSGTEVIWQNCDRLLDLRLAATIDEQLNDKISHANKQLSLIFHRYLSGEARKSFSIQLQGYFLSPTDPFMSLHPATQKIDEEFIHLRGKEKISIQPYIIPHFSKLTVQEKEILGGDEGLMRNQGFYVYRNKRLIIYGTWFRLVQHGELSQLTRVRIDLPNTQDQDWKITLDKSDAQLPAVLRSRLKELVKKFSLRSFKAHRKTGVNLSIDNKQTAVWKRTVQNGRIKYLINREHPLIEQLFSEVETKAISFEAMNLIESCLPIESFSKDHEVIDSKQVQSITDPEGFDNLIDAYFLACVAQVDEHPTLREVLDFTINVEPFSSQWKYTESYIRNNLKAKWKLK